MFLPWALKNGALMIYEVIMALKILQVTTELFFLNEKGRKAVLMLPRRGTRCHSVIMTLRTQFISMTPPMLNTAYK